MHRLVAVDQRYTKAHLKLRWTVLTMQTAVNTARDLTHSDTDPFETLAQIRDHALRMGRQLTDFIDEHQPGR